jgi:ABC-2 type transport system permease protein
MMRRVAAVWHARNLEFFRDRGTFIFSLLLPIALVVGMSFVFGSGDRAVFKIGVLSATENAWQHPFAAERYVDFVYLAEDSNAVYKVERHQLDLLIRAGNPLRYWVNDDSPKGYIAERLLLVTDQQAQRQAVSGEAIRYVDWLFPGIVGMNMMFSCLFGVGYVVLRYRKTGFLQRLHATPLSAFEFLSAQVLSRLTLTLFMSIVIYCSVALLIDFHTAGSVLLLLLIAILGSLSLIALGLTVAARFTSEELVGGVLNLLTWPMMLLSGIWFSLEGSPQWVLNLAQLLPLTHILQASRAVMLDGAGFITVQSNLLYLSITTVIFLCFGAWSFRWRAS